MAEVAVSTVIDKLILLLTGEVKALGNIHKDVEDMRDELESIRAFIKDADSRAEKKDQNDGIKTWIRQLRDAAYCIEDVIDEYLFLIASRHCQKQNRHGVINNLLKFRYLITKLVPRRRISSKIQELKASVQGIKERSERYQFNSFGEGESSKNVTWNDIHLTSLFIEEAEVVGIESTRDELIDRLVNGPSTRTITSIIGMGGLGKTTLAKKVYDSQAVRDKFQCYAWITVSQPYRIDEILHSIMEQFNVQWKEPTPEITSFMELYKNEWQTMNQFNHELHLPTRSMASNQMEVISVIEKLRAHLNEVRYVIILDDVWKTEFWESIKHVFPQNNKGSRVLITSRNRDVGLYCKGSSFDHIHMLKPLPEEQAWELFCRKAFQSESEKGCPPELQKLSQDIVTRCEGLPLAIVTIGGLLSVKPKFLLQWQNLLNCLGSELQNNPRLAYITKILSFSYHDLPYRLKSCFLYIGVFPKDYSISCGKLIRLWIAEGFVKEESGKTVEDVAEKYLMELIHRSLLQVSRVDFDGKVKRCRVHDLMHEFIIAKAKELSLCEVLEGNNTGPSGYTRRVSIQSGTINIPDKSERFSVRSICLFTVSKLPKSLLGKIIRNFSLLKVLEFEDAPIHYIHEEVGNLFNLTYLSVRSTLVTQLPKTIGKLLNLETLDLKYSLVSQLPYEIRDLHKLRHLIAFCGNSGRLADRVIYNGQFNDNLVITNHSGLKVWDGIGCLEALQKLYFVKAKNITMLIKELRRLKQLRKLCITKLRREDGKTFCEALEEMKHLQSLRISSLSEREFLYLEPVSSPPSLLQRLSLQGRLENLPHWISQLTSLVKVRLYWSRLMVDPLRVFEELPSLLQIELYDAYEGEEFHFREGGFKNLRELRLAAMYALKRVEIDRGALPLLEVLTIARCPQFKKVSPSIQLLRNLKDVEIYDVPNEFNSL